MMCDEHQEFRYEYLHEGMMATRFFDRIVVLTSIPLRTQRNNVCRRITKIYSYEASDNFWQRHSTPLSEPAPPFTVRGSLDTIWGSEMYMFGGCHYMGGVMTNALWRLFKGADRTFHWRCVEYGSQASQPAPRCDHASWVYRGKLWIFSGKGGPVDGYLTHTTTGASVDVSTQLLCYEPASERWRAMPVSGAVPTAGDYTQAVCMGERVWLHMAPGHTGSPMSAVLDMRTLQLSYIPHPSPGPHTQLHTNFTWTALTPKRILLHIAPCYDPFDFIWRRSMQAWVFDTETQSWEVWAPGSQDSVVKLPHSHGILILGGGSRSYFGFLATQPFNRAARRRFEPRTLQQLAIQAVAKHRDILNPLDHLPKSLCGQLTRYMYTEEAERERVHYVRVPVLKQKWTAVKKAWKDTWRGFKL